MKKWIGRGVLLAIVVAVVAGVVHSMQPKPMLIDAAAVEAGPMQVSITAEGTTRVKDHYVVRANVHGNLARIELKAGDTVTGETVLARIEPTAPPLLDASQRDELRARARASAAAARQAGSSVSRAEAALKFAKRDLANVEKLFGEGRVSRNELDAAQLAADTTQKELESAKFGSRVAKYESQMAKAAAARAGQGGESSDANEQIEIHAPIGGKVLRLLRKSEGIVQPGEPLLELADPAALEVVMDVLTAEAVEITPGDAVAITQWGGEQPLAGRVTLIEPAAFTKVSALGVEEQRVNVVIDLDGEPQSWARLGDAFRVEAEVTVWQADNVLRLPVSALFRQDGAWAVFVLDGEVARAQPVQLGRRNDFEVQVESGVAAGEHVIVHPSDSIANGVLVAAR